MRAAIQLFLASFLMLFLELALIRWLGSNVLFLSYFSNFVLLASFLGIGIGFIYPKQSSLYLWSPLLLILLVLFVSAFPVRISYEGSGLNNLLLLGHPSKKIGFPVWITLPILFLAVTAVMASIAHITAIFFTKFKPLTAYRLDILGALAGIILFSLLSYLHAAPIFWGCVVVFIYGALFFDEWQRPYSLRYMHFASLSLLLILLGWESSIVNQTWSSYYKISLYQNHDPHYKNVLDVWVNGIPHQSMQPLTRRKITEPFYFFPYQHAINRAAIKNVLIVGAGTGSDVAIALAEGAKSIEAVEIDRKLYELGKKFNPDRPYANNNVHVTIDDGRAFLQRHHDLYDLIIFALPDSLTLVSGQSTLRLESYLFTIEAIQTARQHLKPNGIFAMYNYYWQPWLVDRLALTLQTVFAQTPCIDTSDEKNDWRTVLTVSNADNVLQCATHWSPLSDVSVSPVKDDYPFLYLQKNRIPLMYQITILLILFTTLVIVKYTTGTLGAIKSNLDLFFMGMAFLLLETKSIAAFSLLFGTTWTVNALVFIGILSAVYLAIEITSHVKKLPSNFLYFFLLLALIINWYVPIHSLLSLPFIARFICATVLIFSPIMLANLVFTDRFQYSTQSTNAFGANMIGAMVGGLLEYCAMITGYQSLLVIIALLYTVAFILTKRTQMLRCVNWR